MRYGVVSLMIVVALTVTITFGFIPYFTNPSFSISNIESDSKSAQKFKLISESGNEKIVDKSQFIVAPEFESTGGTLNIKNSQQPITIDNLKGKVVLVNFWTYSCINSLRTLPYLIDWNTKYSDKGLVIVGVHTPEFEFEKDIGNLEDAVKRYGIEYPIIQDNDYKTWNSYANNYWPRMYLIDDQGYIRYDKIGEGDYNQTEMTIQSLLSERNSKMGVENLELDTTSYPNKILENPNNISSFLAQPVDFSKIKTPELFFGYESKRLSLGNPEGYQPGQVMEYAIPSNSSIKPNAIYLEGEWKNNPDNMELQSEFGKIVLTYSAKSVNLVAGGLGQGTVYENNSLLSNSSKGVDIVNESQFLIDGPRLYNIANHQSYDGTHSLIIDVKGKGFQAYTFTFG